MKTRNRVPNAAVRLDSRKAHNTITNKGDQVVSAYAPVDLGRAMGHRI